MQTGSSTAREIPIEGPDDDIPTAQHRRVAGTLRPEGAHTPAVPAPRSHPPANRRGRHVHATPAGPPAWAHCCRLTGPVIHELPDHEHHLHSHLYLNSSQPDSVEEPEGESRGEAIQLAAPASLEGASGAPCCFCSLQCGWLIRQIQKRQSLAFAQASRADESHNVPRSHHHHQQRQQPAGVSLPPPPPPPAADQGPPLAAASRAQQSQQGSPLRAPAAIRVQASPAARARPGAAAEPEEPGSPLLVHVEEGMLHGDTPRHNASAAAGPLPDWLTGDESDPATMQWQPASQQQQGAGLDVRTPAGQPSAAGASPDAPAAAAASRAPAWPGSAGRGADAGRATAEAPPVGIRHRTRCGMGGGCCLLLSAAACCMLLLLPLLLP